MNPTNNPLLRTSNVIPLPGVRMPAGQVVIQDPITALREAQAQATRWQLIALALGGYTAWLLWNRRRAR